MNCYHSLPRWKELLGLTFLIGSGIIALLVTQGRAAENKSLSPDALAGQKVFTSTGCNACHLPETGTIAPSLHGLFGSTRTFADGTTAVADESYLRESILNSTAKVVKGYAPAMPPYATVLSYEQVDQLVAYLKTLE